MNCNPPFLQYFTWYLSLDVLGAILVWAIVLSHGLSPAISKIAEKHRDTAPFTWNRPFATNDHMVQNLPYWRASSLLFPHWDIKTNASQA